MAARGMAAQWRQRRHRRGQRQHQQRNSNSVAKKRSAWRKYGSA